MKNRNQIILRVATSAMFAALAYAVTFLGQVIPKVSGFLSYDPKDAVVVIAGFAFGPIYAVGISLVASLVEMLTISTTGLYGLLMNVVSTCSFALPAAWIYQKNRSKKGAFLGLFCGVLTMVLSMTLWNWIVTPFYMGVDRKIVEGMLLPVFIPFNLAKGGMNAALTLLLYKPMVSALRRMKIISSSRGASRRFYWGHTLFAVCLLAAFVVLFLFLADVI